MYLLRKNKKRTKFKAMMYKKKYEEIIHSVSILQIKVSLTSSQSEKHFN